MWSVCVWSGISLISKAFLKWFKLQYVPAGASDLTHSWSCSCYSLCLCLDCPCPSAPLPAWASSHSQIWPQGAEMKSSVQMCFNSHCSVQFICVLSVDLRFGCLRLSIIPESVNMYPGQDSVIDPLEIIVSLTLNICHCRPSACPTSTERGWFRQEREDWSPTTFFQRSSLQLSLTFLGMSYSRD